MVVLKCNSLTARWEQLSAFLGLPSSLIDMIRASHPGDLSCCWNEALNHWIKQNYNTEKFGKPSWRTLLGAVVHVDRRLFEKLASEHKRQHDPIVAFPLTSKHPSHVQVSIGKHNECMYGCSTILLLFPAVRYWWIYMYTKNLQGVIYQNRIREVWFVAKW